MQFTMGRQMPTAIAITFAGAVAASDFFVLAPIN
jgi:hypothetical protein